MELANLDFAALKGSEVEMLCIGNLYLDFFVRNAKEFGMFGNLSPFHKEVNCT